MYSLCNSYMLVKPNDDYSSEWLNFVEEVKCEDSVIIPRLLYKSGDNYDDFLNRVNLKEAMGNCGVFFLVSKDEPHRIIGCTVVRYKLNEELRKRGGNGSGCIRPSMRGCGLGKVLFLLALKEIKSRGYNEILMTCRSTNLASREMMRSAGGVFLREVNGVEYYTFSKDE